LNKEILKFLTGGMVRATRRSTELVRFSVTVGASLAQMTTFRIGGVAGLFVEPLDQKSLESFIQFLREIGSPWRLLGGGSNLLVANRFFPEPIISLRRCASFIEVMSETDDVVVIRVGGGVKTRTLLNYCVRRGLSGCEFLAGIPATLGGAVFMNAGTSDGTMQDIVDSVTVIDRDKGMLKLRQGQGADFHPLYRSSGIANGSVVYDARLKLRKNSPEKIRGKICSIMKRRLATQPIGMPSAGCVFKNPSSDLPAGLLIDHCGLKGFRIGGAEISRKHANWIINTGGASYNDVVTLMALIKDRVYEQFTVKLEEEVQCWD